MNAVTEYSRFPQFIAVDYPHIAVPVCVMFGKTGYMRLPAWIKTMEQADMYLLRCHGGPRPTRAQRDAAFVGSMRGWSDPSADPAWWEQKDSVGVAEGLDRRNGKA